MKKNNQKGFSLIELIIVIAIMAVLIGLIAPQYLKYVEKSRIATAMNNADSVANAITALVIDEAANYGDYYELVTQDGLTIKLDGTETANADLANAILGQIGVDSVDGNVTFVAGEDFPTFTYEMTSGKYGVDYRCRPHSDSYVEEKGDFHCYRK